MATQRASAKCKVCREPSTMTAGLHRVCSVDCALTLARKIQQRKAALAAKADRKAHKEARAKTKRRQDLVAEAQTAFNAWVRARDAGKPCVSCGHPDDGSRQRHAGHFKPAGSNPALRFEPDNCHAQCSRCNLHLSGNLVLYREELARRIGEDRLAWLEGPHQPTHYTREHLETIRRDFRRMARELAR